jgi:hypothetical protein
MKTRVVKRYRAPRYPAKLQVLADPALLRQNVPPAWLAVPQLAGAVALFLSANTTLCRGADKGAGSAGAAVVAPIFNHGEGRGATGCIVVAPPVFLSEEEALQMIEEEMAKGGVNLTEKKHPLSQVTKPLAHQLEDGKGNITIQPRGAGGKRDWLSPGAGKEGSFEVDALDPKKRIAVEFVSTADFQQRCGSSWERPDGSMCISSVSTYLVKDYAGFVAKHVKDQSKEKLYFGALYDPCGCVMPKDSPPTNDLKVWQQRYEAAAKASKAESERLLRLQVQDFVKWLQAQGAI